MTFQEQSPAPRGRGGMLTPGEFAAAYKVSLPWLAKARRREEGPRFVRLVAPSVITR